MKNGHIYVRLQDCGICLECGEVSVYRVIDWIKGNKTLAIVHQTVYNLSMASKYAQAFAQNLSALLKVNNMTQSQLAKTLNIPQQTVSRYASGKREITLEYLCKIADYFGEDVDVLIGRREYWGEKDF